MSSSEGTHEGHDLDSQILGLAEPWFAEAVELDPFEGRVDCPEHSVVQVKVPWAESKGRFTLLIERLIIDVLTECATVTGARRTWDEAWEGRERKQSQPARGILVLTRRHCTNGTIT